MRHIKAKASFGFVGAEYNEEFEFPDEYSNEEIEADVYEWAQQFVEVEWADEEPFE